MKKKNIILMHYSYPPIVGGVESVMHKHAELLSEHGYSVKILIGRGRSLNPNIEVNKFDLLDSTNQEILKLKKVLDTGEIPADFDSTKNEIKEWLQLYLREADLVIAHNICTLHKNLPLSTALYDLVQDPSTPPLIAWDHDFAWDNKQYSSQVYDRWPWDILKKTWSQQKQIHVTVSKNRKSQLEKLLNVPPSTIHIISSGIEYDRIMGLTNQTLEILDYYSLVNSYPIILLPARITKRKNIEFALKIINEIKKYYPSTVLIITGPPGPHNPKNRTYFQELQDLRSKLKLDPGKVERDDKPRVIFLAEYSEEFIPMDTVYEFFRISDALLFPSFQEGFGIPILEAGITRLPIFCSNIQPFHETAGELANYFELNDDPSEIALRIFNFLEKDKSSQMRKRVRQNFTWEGIFTNQIEPLIKQTFDIVGGKVNG